MLVVEAGDLDTFISRGKERSRMIHDCSPMSALGMSSAGGDGGCAPPSEADGVI